MTGREKNKQPQISLNWAQAVLRVEYQELPEGMIRETKVVMEDATPEYLPISQILS